VTKKLLDLFCGAGGAAVGYSRAGFEVIGVDLDEQKNYPFEFIKMDAFEALEKYGPYVDAVHASPPCQGYSVMRNLGWHDHIDYPLLIDPLRKELLTLGKPYVIENVMGAKLDANYLCGTMFNLRLYRHRLFETNFFWLAPGHPRHEFLFSMPGAPKPRWAIDGKRRNYRLGDAACGSYPQHAGANWKAASEAMEIDWMTKKELTQAIPPAYTEYVGNRLRELRFEAV
jgi:DNA (cytosine-5)-methyltransferase 1